MVSVKNTGIEKMETINVGIFGHIDHGKTTLLHKLTGVWASRYTEELKRGITIKLGYADVILYNDNGEFNTEGKGEAIRHISFVDSPGHEMLMATMMSGAALIDVAILLVSANEGIKPQTREHLMALQAKKIKNIIIVQNKIDLIDKDKAKKNYEDIKEFLKGKCDAPIIPVSAQQGINVQEIWKALVEMKIPERDTKSEPVFLIARSFDINRPGTTPKDLHGAVLGGTLKKGVLKIGDVIEIKPGRLVKEANQYRFEKLKCKIESLFKGSKKIDHLTPGGSMSIETSLDMALGKSDMLAGNVVSLEDKLPEITTHLKINYSLFPQVYGVSGEAKVENLKISETLMLSVNTSITAGIVRSLKNNVLEVELKMPIVAFKGDNIGIARSINAHWRLIGYGEIV